ncbi:MAG: coproporphyrinogen-III oxidase family protein [Verrucomicrobia bacterium]|nr:coproporphyrinogen-III oxidase family protein [Verrucomicrobiota bacterium]
MNADTPTDSPKETAAEQKTKAGSYFVANYPLFNAWSPDETPAVLDAINRPAHPDTKLGLYIHIPFCRKRCHFCYFKVYTGANSEVIRAYISTALNELEMYATKPFINGRKLDFVYFGGGTPSFLSTDQLEELTSGMKRLLPWDSAREIAFECEPGTLTEPRLQAIRDLGVTRLSLGIENFSDDVLEINGRAHRSDAVYAVYDFARKIGFPQINIDLISGMLNETEENWKYCIEQTIALSPESVTIYQMEIPYNTTIFKRMKAEGALTAPVADWPTKRAWVKYAFEQLEQNGYEIVSGYTAVKRNRDMKFIYRDELWQGADLLSVGVASFGHIGGVHYQNQQDMAPYMAAIQSGTFPIFRSCETNESQRLIREFILQCKLGHISTHYFRDKFKVDIRERFKIPLAEIERLGYLQHIDERIVFNREGLLRIDWLLQEIFLKSLSAEAGA